MKHLLIVPLTVATSQWPFIIVIGRSRKDKFDTSHGDYFIICVIVYVFFSCAYFVSFLFFISLHFIFHYHLAHGNWLCGDFMTMHVLFQWPECPPYRIYLWHFTFLPLFSWKFHSCRDEPIRKFSWHTSSDVRTWSCEWSNQ